MDGLYDTLSEMGGNVNGLLEILETEEYDTDAVKEDVPASNNGKNCESNIQEWSMNPDQYSVIQQYVYFNKCMSIFIHFVDQQASRQ